MQKLKAYRIITAIHRDGDFGVYSALTAGKAKTQCFMDMRDAYPDATYAWIRSCRRAPEHDVATETGTGCIAWKNSREWWHIKRGHNYEPEVMFEPERA